MILRRILVKNGFTLCAVAVGPSVFADSFKGEKWNRVKQIFQTDNYGVLSPQISCWLQTTMSTLFGGAIFGGFLESREKYFEFVKSNEATKFLNHFDARSQLQKEIGLSFCKGGWYWGWRLSAFCGLFMTYVTFTTTYRGEAKFIDFPLAGLFAGAVYRANLGLRGMIASGTLGFVMGIFSGVLTMTILKISGKTLFDLQVQSQQNAFARRKIAAEAVEQDKMDHLNQDDLRILKNHDPLSDLAKLK